MTDTRSEARQRHAEHLRAKASVMAREEAKAAAQKAEKPAKQSATVKPKKA